MAFVDFHVAAVFRCYDYFQSKTNGRVVSSSLSIKKLRLSPQLFSSPCTGLTDHPFVFSDLVSKSHQSTGEQNVPEKPVKLLRTRM
jgi:hypothetical protein